MSGNNHRAQAPRNELRVEIDVPSSSQRPTSSNSNNHRRHEYSNGTTRTSDVESEDNFDWKNATILDRNARHENSPDQILSILGSENVYLQLIWFAAATCWGFAAMPMMASTFFMHMPCNDPEQTAEDWPCPPKDRALKCAQLNGTLIEEFGVEDIDSFFSIPQLSTAMYLAGIIIGSLVLPRLSDRIGRHPILCFSLIMAGTFGCLSAIVPNVYMFIVLRMLQGVCFPGISITNWVLAYESIASSLHSYTAFLFGVCWVVGYCSIGPLAYYLPNWRWLAFSASLPSLIFGILYLHFLPESFHWLASNGDENGVRAWIDRANYFAEKCRTKQALNIPFRHFCRVNMKKGKKRRSRSMEDDRKKAKSFHRPMKHLLPSPSRQPILEGCSSSMATAISSSGSGTSVASSETPPENEQQGGCTPTPMLTPIMVGNGDKKDEMLLAPVPEAPKKNAFHNWLEKSGHLLWIYTAIFAYLWTCNTFIYYGLSLFSTKLVGDVYWNYVLVGFAEIPSYAVSPYLLDKFGRKIFIAGAHTLAAFSYLCIVLNDSVPDWTDKLKCPLESVTLTMWLLGKFAISCSFTSLFVYASEIFPTTSRNSKIGICAACSRIGATMVPFVEKIPRRLQLALYGGTALLGALVTLFLPETKNRKLPASKAEVQTVKKQRHSAEKKRLSTPAASSS